LESLEAKSRAERQKWEMVKSVVSATIVASGVDWARDDDLRRLVMDEMEDD
jgi:hypothetical protein